MIKHSTMTVAVLACLATTGCAVNRYPMAQAWSPTSASLTCAQLTTEVEDGRRLQTRIDAIAAGDPAARAERPQLYSTAKSDADRAVQTRLSAIEAQKQAKGCL